MQSIILKQAVEYNFQSYVYGNTFAFYIDFFQDSAGTIPTDLTGSNFVMDFLREDGGCCFQNNLKESLTIGDGLTITDQLDKDGNVVNTNNRLNISKVLSSTEGLYRQSITWTDTLGVIFTCERGTLRIDKKI